MSSVRDTGIARPGPVATDGRHRFRRVLTTGLVSTLGAVVATSLVTALARAVGADLRISGSEETIPPSGVAVVTGFCCAAGVVLAAALLGWSARPADRFVCTTVSLTGLSLVPPVLSAADAATAVTLVCLHLVAAAVVIPVLARGLRAATIPEPASAPAHQG